MKEVKDHNPTDKELTQLILLTKKIWKTGKAQGIEMSKTQARKAAAAHLGFVDSKFRDEILREEVFNEGRRTANERYNKAT